MYTRIKLFKYLTLCQLEELKLKILLRTPRDNFFFLLNRDQMVEKKRILTSQIIHLSIPDRILPTNI